MAPLPYSACALLALVLALPAQAKTVSFIGCERSPAEAGDGPNREWRICRTSLPIADVRGRGREHGEKVAMSGSHQYVILKVHGNRRDVIERAERVLRVLIAGGWTKLGLVLADGQPATVMEVFSGGRPHLYERMSKVDAYDGESGISEVVTEAYLRDIGPRGPGIPPR